MEFFIGVVPPDELYEQVVAFQRQWPANQVPLISEPHVTVKAQGGLTEDLAWLEAVREACARTAPFAMTITKPGMFGEAVLFLDVQSAGVYELHQRLVEAVNPPPEVRARYFEDGRFEAHLTLGIAGMGMTVEEVAAMREMAEQTWTEKLTFDVTFVRVYRKVEGQTAYEKWVDLPLATKRAS